VQEHRRVRRGGRRFISEAGIERPAIGGHSMGGAIALTIAVKYPRDLSSLIVMDTGAKLGVLPSIRDGLLKNPLQTIERVITPLSFYRADDELLRESRGTLAIPNLDVFLNDYAACDVFDIRERVSELSARTLIMCGEYDKLTPPIRSHYLNARIPPSTAFFIRDSGHMVPLEKPNASGRLIIDILATPSR